MSNILSAKEFIKKHYEEDVKNHFLNFNREGSETYKEYAERNPLKTLEEGFIEFAKLHVEQAILKAATYAESYKTEQSILNCYPIEKIK